MSEKRCILVGAGAHYKSDIITPCSDDYVIAVDGGYDHLKEKDITPDLILGDFDSIDGGKEPDTAILKKDFPGFSSMLFKKYPSKKGNSRHLRMSLLKSHTCRFPAS